MTTTFVWLELLLHELLLFSAIWFLIGALDDLLIDLIWVVRRAYRRLRYYRREKPMRACDLPPPASSGKIAVFVAAWQESEVIGAMLQQCRDAWRNEAGHIIYVGCYPNDNAGISAIIAAATDNPAVRLVLCANPGPTTKADCLNRLWQAMCADELAEGYKIKTVVLHDAEDMVHADELKIYSRLIEKNHIVQLPVIPIRVAGSRWISGHYCDEFAEAHGKSLVVREAVGAPLPLAGVGCAIERNMLGRIALAQHHKPFDIGSLTEDYELGLKIGEQGGRAILARLLDRQGELVGTRACFPDTLEASVKQKARWITGISLTGWDRLGWRSSIVENWMILRDRRAVFAAIVLTIAYICVVLTGVLVLLHLSGRISTPRTARNDKNAAVGQWIVPGVAADRARCLCMEGCMGHSRRYIRYRALSLQILSRLWRRGARWPSISAIASAVHCAGRRQRIVIFPRHVRMVERRGRPLVVWALLLVSWVIMRAVFLGSPPEPFSTVSKKPAGFELRHEPWRRGR